MWLFFLDGMISAVAAKKKSGASVIIDETKIMVRSRERETLEALQRQFPALLQGVALKETAFTDYRYRMVVSRDAWVSIATELAKAVSYGNFKGAVHAKHGASRYERVLHRVWSEVATLQRPSPRDKGDLFDTVSTEMRDK